MPRFVGRDGGLVYESVGKADLLSNHFDSKQSGMSVDLPLTWHPSSRLTTFAFRLGEVTRLLLDLYTYAGTDTCIGYVSCFSIENSSCSGPPPRLSVVFWCLVRLGSFPRAGDRPMSPLF